MKKIKISDPISGIFNLNAGLTGTDLKLFILVGWGRSFLPVTWPTGWCFSFAPELVSYSAPRDLRRRAAYSIC